MPFPRLVLTMGEPAGIGPDLCLDLARRPLPAALVVVGNYKCLRRRAEKLSYPLLLHRWQPGTSLNRHHPHELHVLDVPLQEDCEPGVLRPANSQSILRFLDQAVHLCRTGEVDGMVTAPIHKGVINEAGVPFSGHTEYLAEKTNTSEVVMLLAGRGMRVALATTHLPLKEVSGALSQGMVERKLRILHHGLRHDFGVLEPRIVVAGLNPHAGESGHLGREEVDVIVPALVKLRAEGLDLRGPLPADTLFTPRHLEGIDAVFAMYHDQGLPVLKYHAFGEAVNVTVGLPLVRVSVDHGTALDLAGSGRADPSSLFAAVEVALEIVKRRKEAVLQE